MNSQAAPARKYVIGVDFDNTLVSYDALLQSLARERGWLPEGTYPSKKEIRDFLRRLPEGEEQWQRLQAVAYGPRIAEARPAEGAEAFFQCCKRRGAKVYIVSHKTELAGYDETGTNLRTAALAWMTAHRFFAPDGLGLSPDAVCFGATRREKIARIEMLGCTHFIDDLEETFLEDCFPAEVEKILYAPRRLCHAPPGVKLAESWEEIAAYVFGLEAEGGRR